MSIRLMTMIFDRYPEGGSEMLLALAMNRRAREAQWIASPATTESEAKLVAR